MEDGNQWCRHTGVAIVTPESGTPHEGGHGSTSYSINRTSIIVMQKNEGALTSLKSKKSDQHTHDMARTLRAAMVMVAVGAVRARPCAYRGQAPSLYRCQAWLAWSGLYVNGAIV